jgi:hypothetical protein
MPIIQQYSVESSLLLGIFGSIRLGIITRSPSQPTFIRAFEFPALVPFQHNFLTTSNQFRIKTTSLHNTSEHNAERAVLLPCLPNRINHRLPQRVVRRELNRPVKRLVSTLLLPVDQLQWIKRVQCPNSPLSSIESLKLVVLGPEQRSLHYRLDWIGHKQVLPLDVQVVGFRHS